ncbi:MAG: hypothetical protein GEV28_17685 [Actinophytocola sp.]|uniref:nitroreductase family protein n=1 Tax=Actinophytocola sp. TaxID=1872138 RepID=UPI001326FEAC|nr:nitroreductase family protein [Actinophytocola sp.]MPZ82121.1 hypothetical protein [Actinophytocola sp.]
MTASEHVRLLRDLRSVRRFTAEPVAQHVIDDLLDVVRWTGSSSNRQPWELVLVRNRETVAALADIGGGPGARHLADATLAIVLVMANERADFDAGRCAERVLLTLAAHGIGACVAGFARPEQGDAVKQLLGVPADRTIRIAISAGHPAGDRAHLVSAERDVDDRLPLHTMRLGRKPLAEIVHLERYGSR